MSYLDSLDNSFIIVTGDNAVYSSEQGKRPNNPKYGLKILQQSYSQHITYQLGEFNFINVSGKLIKQTTPLGRVFPMEIYFDGPDHLEITEQFRLSANNVNHWTITHPIYGQIIVKTSSLNFNNSSISYTKVSGTMIETIAELGFANRIIAMDQIPLLKDIYVEDAVLSLSETPTPTDIIALTNDNKAAFQNAVPIITLPEDFEKLNNAYNTALTYINVATSEPLLMMRATMQVLLLPSQFDTAVRQRLNVLINTFNQLRQTLFGIIGVSSKQLFQNKAGCLIASICNAAATPLETDYKNSFTVLEVISNIVAARNAYYEDMDSLQTPNGGSLLSFVPNSQAINSLNTLVNTTISALYEIALNAKSQRSIICEKDTNAILLTHRVYGLDTNDNNINDLIEANNLSLNELLIIEKDRNIVYFV